MVNVTDGNFYIPKIIHQIAPKDKSKWHPLWFKCQESWLKHFPDFEYKLWNDEEDIDNLVYTYYPEFASLYKMLPFHIMKIDFARFCILHKFGGIYGDMDYYVYKNFYFKLNKENGFLHNLTNEYTTSVIENSLMYSVGNNNLLICLMKACKVFFIQNRNQFKRDLKNWRSYSINNTLVNNITGSGMVSSFVSSNFNAFSVQYLECQTFNNRPASYDPSFFGKHIHSSLWGNEYSNNQPTHFLIKNDGTIYNSYIDNDNNFAELKNPYHFFPVNDFDFYKNYTDSNYLKEDNLNELLKYLNKLN